MGWWIFIFKYINNDSAVMMFLHLCILVPFCIVIWISTNHIDCKTLSFISFVLSTSCISVDFVYSLFICLGSLFLLFVSVFVYYNFIIDADATAKIWQIKFNNVNSIYMCVIIGDCYF